MKKLIFLFAILFSNSLINAQSLVVVNVNTTIYFNDSIFLDIDQNGTNDYLLFLRPTDQGNFDTTGASYIKCLDTTNYVASLEFNQVYYPNKYSNNDTINNLLSYNSSLYYSGSDTSYLLLHTTGWVWDLSGFFKDFQGSYFNPIYDAFIGIRFLIGNNCHYGWIRIDKGGNEEWLTVKTIAYNPIPNSSAKCMTSLNNIEHIYSHEKVKFVVFDLLGRKFNVSNTHQLKTGIYIINGKKRFIMNN